MNYVLLSFIILLLMNIYLKNSTETFGFMRVLGGSFGEYISPQACTPENNCFKGSYFRSQ